MAGSHSSIWRCSGYAANWREAASYPGMVGSLPTPPPTSTMEPSGSRTVFACPRPITMEAVDCQPAPGLLSSNTAVVFVEWTVLSLVPPRAMILPETPVALGSITAVPQSRRWSSGATGDQLKLLAVGVFMYQVLNWSGPTTSVLPEGIANMCG